MEHSQRFQDEYKTNALVILKSDMLYFKKYTALVTLDSLLTTLYYPPPIK
ncbi:hypothetical protein WS105_0155 [Weissella ceti]|uniref:Uncharacterized protein n=2 Tax=Weissella TaxID=46255 RepID=A0A075TY06_9LACO|nr:hypothetical protein WS08_0156 [Weissella tructae]AIM62408.1 hypothetical protein WS74_0156 [Weissella ceti]AIM63745.1 hypothetical protein WS105_0155 [Weissella ceti]